MTDSRRGRSPKPFDQYRVVMANQGVEEEIIIFSLFCLIVRDQCVHVVSDGEFSKFS